MTRRVVLLLAAASVLCGLCPPAGALVVRDAADRSIEVATPVRRVVFLSLYDLIPVFDVWDRVAGINRWAFQSELLRGFPQIRGIPSLGTSDSLNVEALLALHPDLVITWSYKPEVADFLIGRGLKVISVYPESLEELHAVIELCGSLFEKKERAREIRSLMDAGLAEIAARVSGIPEGKRKKVLWIWQQPTTVSGGIGLQQELVELAGAVNPAKGYRAKHATVSAELAVAWNPDVIFIWGNARYGPGDILSSPRWRSVRAVRDKKVFKAPALTTWSPAVIGMVSWIAWKTYPEYFDPAVLSEDVRKFHERCFGIPLDGFSFD